jgi:hypothetical protein
MLRIHVRNFWPCKHIPFKYLTEDSKSLSEHARNAVLGVQKYENQPPRYCNLTTVATSARIAEEIHTAIHNDKQKLKISKPMQSSATTAFTKTHHI